jgi:hypothetical protein
MRTRRDLGVVSSGAFGGVDLMQTETHELDGLERSVLQLLSNQTDDDDQPTWISFNEICLKIGTRKDSHAGSHVGGNSPEDIEDIERVLEHAHGDGLVDKYEVGSVRNTPVRLSDQGVYEASGFADLVVDNPIEPTKEEFIGSEEWTGRVLRQEQVAELVSNIDAALRNLDNLGLPNEKMAQARALLLAARTLSEAPEPPLEIISWLLAHFDRLVGITGLLVGVASLVKSWTN